MKVAVIGASGAVGRAMVRSLERLEQTFDLGLFASPRSAGETLTYKGKTLRVQPYAAEALQGYQYALMSVSGDFSKQESPKLVELGVTVIDNSSAFRSDLTIPLVVPSVNGASLDKMLGKPGIVANPNCSTIQLVVCLQPLKEKFGLLEVAVSTYQSTSGAGKKGIDDLLNCSKQVLNFQEPEARHFPVPVGFNVIPGIGDIDAETGYCVEEQKMYYETRRILGMPHLEVLPTTIRVPTFNCHCESALVRLGEEVSKEQVLEAFANQDDLVVSDSNQYQELPTPLTVAGKDEVFVARVRLPFGKQVSDRVQMWIVADNLLKGAATNAVDILQYLLQRS